MEGILKLIISFDNMKILRVSSYFIKPCNFIYTFIYFTGRINFRKRGKKKDSQLDVPRRQFGQLYQMQLGQCLDMSQAQVHYPSSSAGGFPYRKKALQIQTKWRAQPILLLWQHKELKGFQLHIEHLYLHNWN